MDTAVFSSISLFCVATASVFGWLLAYYHVPDAVSAFLGRFAESPILIMAIINIVFLMVGTFMDAIPAIMILAPVIGPIAHAAGIHPIHLGVVIVMNLAIGLMTPPYGLLPAAGLYNCQDTGQASPAGIGALLHHHDRHLACGHLLAGSGDVRPETIDTSVLIILGGSD